jgi:hypothetical protein
MLQTWESCDLNNLLYRLGVQLEELPSEEQKQYAGMMVSAWVSSVVQCVVHDEPNKKIDKQITQLGLPRTRAHTGRSIFVRPICLGRISPGTARADQSEPRSHLAT